MSSDAAAHDYVVVGAGSAGCAVAARLSEDPDVRVLLLEAGPPDGRVEMRIPAAWPKLLKSDVDWDYETVSQEGLAGRRVYWPRGKTLGGSSSINALMWIRGHPSDYDGWAEAGCEGWSYEDVLPSFRRIPVSLSDQRDPSPLTLALVEAAVEAGLERNEDFNGERLEGAGLVQVTQRRGRRSSAADAYLRPARENLTVVTGVHVTRVLVEEGRAVGVAYVHDGHEHEERAACEVIASAGAVGSPQLLLLSGIGPADDLRALGIPVAVDLPGVGRNLRDHLAGGVLASVTQPLSLAAAQSRANLVRYLTRRRGMLTSNVAEAAAFVRTKAELPAPDLELVFAPALYLDQGLTLPSEHGVTVGTVALRPRSVGAIRLASADPLAPPLIDPGYLTDDEGEDLRVLVEGVRLARRVLHGRAFAPYLGEEILPGAAAESDEEIGAVLRERAHTLYHPVGTCRMGVDEGAVVDPELRVRGVEGLRVADASVMPTLISGHTHAPAVMIGEKAADLIRQSR